MIKLRLNKSCRYPRHSSKLIIKSIAKFKEVKNILKKFSNKYEAIEYLINETNLAKEECSTAYDIIIKIKD